MSQLEQVRSLGVKASTDLENPLSFLKPGALPLLCHLEYAFIRGGEDNFGLMGLRAEKETSNEWFHRITE